ncbi:MAG: tRNA (N6-isopentenyl adenosine(37)-C2)-methylthiotransferase MiaB [Lachnospiraceae bacterium]|nr:tRNA (N6-isopentenyl adenosine(37)-C2)-methylthiotransferase MiaB [Lachnospiraceae bacterium]
MTNTPDFHSKEKIRQDAYLEKLRTLTEDLFAERKAPLTFHVVTFGCQMNAKDSEKLSGVLKAAGFLMSETEDADLVLFNTCTVRDNADQRLFGRLGRLSHLKKKRPHAKIALCGCMMQEASNVEKIKKSYPYVDLIFGTHNLYRFPEYLYTMYTQDAPVIDIWEKTDDILEDLPTDRKYPFKSGVNIMFGCNNFCSYCIVPYVRGRERSREKEEILAEIRTLVQSGVKEVMLLGQNVNSYGRGLEKACTFPELLREVSHVEGLARVRFMTPHPKDFSPELLQVIAEEKTVARHIHLPLQSGSTKILREMNRRYTKEDYLSLAERIRRDLPDVAITTDIIVGFPTETMEDVEDTLDVIDRVQFDNAYTFIYSPRRGTPAAALPKALTDEEIHAAFDRVLARVQHNARIRAGLLEGETHTALFEEVNEKDPSLITGRLSNNMIVHVPGDPSLIGSFRKVFLKECHGFYYFGEIAKE